MNISMEICINNAGVALPLFCNRTEKKPNAQLDEKRYHAWIFINELRATTCFPFFIIKMAACVCV